METGITIDYLFCKWLCAEGSFNRGRGCSHFLTLVNILEGLVFLPMAPRLSSYLPSSSPGASHPHPGWHKATRGHHTALPRPCLAKNCGLTSSLRPQPYVLVPSQGKNSSQGGLCALPQITDLKSCSRKAGFNLFKEMTWGLQPWVVQGWGAVHFKEEPAPFRTP